MPRRAQITVFVAGAYGHRQPLAYAPIRDAAAGRIATTDRLEAADIVAVAHWKDVVAHGPGLIARLSPAQRLVLLSEEPFWDTLWCPAPFAPRLPVPGREPDPGPDPGPGSAPGSGRASVSGPGPESGPESGPDPRPGSGARGTVALVTHFTSRVYDFDETPYFLLTDTAYTARYATRLAALAAQPAAAWQAAQGRAPYDVAFMLERRPHPAHDVVFPAEGAMGLAAHRTRIAEACTGPRVLRAGKGWGPQTGAQTAAQTAAQTGVQPGAHTGAESGPQPMPPRTALADWHADKLDRLAGQARAIFAMENTWWPTYVTEKPFDALACGAVPIALGGPGHRLHDLFPEPCWLDLAGLTPRQAARRIAALRLDAPRIAALRAAAARLAAQFADPARLARERDRLVRALAAALAARLDG